MIALEIENHQKMDYQKTWEALNSLESVTSKICSAREILDSAIESLESGNRQKTETLLYAADEFLQYYLEDFDRKFKVAWDETVVKLHKEDEDHYNAVLSEKEYYEPSMPPWGHSDLEYRGSTVSSSQYETKNGVNYNQYVKAKIEANSAWNDGWTREYYQNIVDKYEGKQDKVKRWVLPVEEVENGDNGEQEYFITFPDDLLEAANLKEGDSVEYLDRGDGSYLLTKVKHTGRYQGPSWYQEALEEGYTHEELKPKEEKKLTYDEAIAAGWTMTADGFWIKE
jgi:bifunctional DNA-binding transcriptional regulator/antitoxin component of YhaV-PrlF toxin-antitoxin module